MARSRSQRAPDSPQPDTLDLNALMQPIESRSVLRDPDWFIWGGGCVKAPGRRSEDGQYHMLFARWPKKEGFNAWVTHSEIAHATAADPLGPWTVTGRAQGMKQRLGFWDADNLHNPLVLQFDNKYYLYYSGNFGPRDGTKEGWWIHRNNQRLGVAVADHPAGPWKRFDKPLLEPTPGSFDGLLVNSPTVARNSKGQYVMVYKGVSEGKMPFGGKVRMGLATADNPLGPWKKENITLFDHPTEQFPTDDNYIWCQNDRFYAIVKDYRGFYTQQARAASGRATSGRPGSTEKESLVLFTSETGRDWRLAAHPFVSDFRLRWTDGRVSERLSGTPLHRLDQPQVWLENGKPSVLFLAVKANDDNDDSDLSYNVQIKLKG